MPHGVIKCSDTSVEMPIAASTVTVIMILMMKSMNTANREKEKE